MNEVQKISDGDLFSISRLQRLTGMDRRTIAKRLADVMPAGIRAGHPVYSLKDVGPALYAPTEQLSIDDPDKLSAKERLDWYKGETEKRKLQERDGELVQAAEVEREFSDLIDLMVTTIESLPDILERDAGIDGAAVTRAHEVIDDLRHRLFMRAREDGQAVH